MGADHGPRRSLLEDKEILHTTRPFFSGAWRVGGRYQADREIDKGEAAWATDGLVNQGASAAPGHIKTN